MRVVVDTDVLVSGLLRSGSPPAAVISAIAELRLTPVVCDAVVQEYAAVLLRPRFHFAAADVRELLVLLEQQADWVDVPAYAGIPSLPDPADWPFLACALAADCPVITGNAKHFPAALGVRIMTAREWLDGQIKPSNAL